ncbi:MAG: lipopolysaccharide biosynthesis protein [Thermoleophilaceae bacterium]
MSLLPDEELGTPGVMPDGVGPDGRFRGTPEAGLRSRAARGTVINAVFLTFLNSVALIKGVLVASLLSTAAYGLWTLVLVSLGTLVALFQVGIDDKYIQQDRDDQEAAFQVAFTLQCLLVGVFIVLMVVTMPLFGLAYGRWEMVGPGIALAAAAPATAFQAPLWIHYRRMDFRRQRLLQVADPIISLVVTVALAAAGLGVWSLVAGLVAGAWATALLAVRSSPYRLRIRFERESLREYAGFSWPLFAAALSAIIFVQVPTLIADRAIGLAAVGALALAMNISAFTTRVDEVVTQALYPAVCAVKDRVDLLFESFSKSNRLALLWALPCGVAAALFASDFVHLVIGEKWRLAVGLIEAFGLTAAVNQVGFNWTAFFRARGDTRPIAIVNFVQLIAVMAISVPLLVTDGLRGFALGTLIATPITVAARMWFVTRIFPALRVLDHLWRSVVPATGAGLVMLALRAIAPGGRGPVRVIAELVLFGVLCAAATLAVERPLLREAVGYLRRRQVAAPEAAVGAV